MNETDFVCKEFPNDIFSLSTPLWMKREVRGGAIMQTWLVAGSCAVPEIAGFRAYIEEKFSLPVIISRGIQEAAWFFMKRLRYGYLIWWGCCCKKDFIWHVRLDASGTFVFAGMAVIASIIGVLCTRERVTERSKENLTEKQPVLEPLKELVIYPAVLYLLAAFFFFKINFEQNGIADIQKELKEKGLR